MAKINLVHQLVYDTLKNNPETRTDDFILIREVLSYWLSGEMSIDSLFLNHKQLGIPSFETITRCRRKIQEQFPELVNAEVEELREQEEGEYVHYALNLHP